MSENKENINSPGWRDVQQAYADVIMEIRSNSEHQQTLASETIRDLQNQCSKKNNIIWHTITIAFLSVLAAFLMMNIHQAKSEDKWRQTVERINQSWIDYLSEYDFVTQDGEGINYYNADIGGNVNNGATNPPTKE